MHEVLQRAGVDHLALLQSEKRVLYQVPEDEKITLTQSLGMETMVDRLSTIKELKECLAIVTEARHCVNNTLSMYKVANKNLHDDQLGKRSHHLQHYVSKINPN